MTRKSDRLDEYVRQATELDADRTAALVDPIVKQALFEEITRMQTSDQPTPSHQPARRPVQLAVITGGIAIVAVAVLAATGVFGSRSQPPPVTASSPTQQSSSPERQGDVFGPGIAGSCVETYSSAAVTKRGFAFDGTVASIGKHPSTSDESDPYVPVTFTVHQWFRGGQGDQVTVAMFPPDVTTTVDNASYAVGSRLLVSGEDRRGKSPMDSPIAWACGVTRWYNQADAQSWDQAFD